MASHIPFKTLSQKQKVLSLYKRACRSIDSWYHDRLVMRYKCILMRQKFEENRNIKDPIKIAELINNGEQKLWETQHWQPKIWAKTIGGNAYGREAHIPDWVLDYWHPLEKAQYPEYFARREQRKKEFIKMWEEEYAKTN